MFTQLRTLFRQVMHEGSEGGAIDTPTMNLAMASLLCEVANADYEIDPREESAKVHLLVNLLDIDETRANSLLDKARKQSNQSVSLYEFTTKLRALMPEQRYQLIEAMWQVAYADGVIDPLEEAVIRQVAELIYVDHSEFIRAKLSAQDK
ncbi:tellurite resistance TerB family protein [Photobacterium alginatilyticum]|uniref:TerB family tellurite resistance protein n=1 Tax=Photobacterium alginatilyticum TaxID=1775171 RepID=A0ABW9YQK8_9GAMM|nr:TerB family tellurite resistance protein [Photobacterium alginatilyticum]NBI56131.1 TerB family tellurite resistance protein [Photobacterium alginatilyticum]